MDIKEALDCMNSDFAIWGKAETKDLGGGRVEKTLILPWGIGPVTVVLEGMKDAGKKRDAVGSYGEYIRSVIREAISDDAVTARAKQAAARVKQDDSSDSPIIGGEPRVRDTAVQEEVDAPAGEAYKEHAKEPVGLREAFLTQRSDIEDELRRHCARRDESIRRIKELARAARALEKALDSLEEEDDADEQSPKERPQEGAV